MANQLHATAVRIRVEDLGQHLATLESELSDGRSIELVRNERVVAELRAKTEQEHVRPAMPDFMGRMKAIWGDKVFPEGYMTQAIREDRDARG